MLWNHDMGSWTVACKAAARSAKGGRIDRIRSYARETIAKHTRPTLPSRVYGPSVLTAIHCLHTLEAMSPESHMLSSYSMQRLDYRLKEFTRHAWLNDEAKEVWEPRIRKVCDCIGELEWVSVLEGMRACALRIVTAEQLQPFGDRIAAHGLVLAPLEKMAVGDWYSSGRTPPRKGEPFDYWCAIGRTTDVELLKSAHLGRDVETVGKLLGYPSCCTRFFQEVRIRQDFSDTTWPMAQNTADKRSITSYHVEIPHVSIGNILLRWLGLRLVFHLPCSFACQSTVELAARFAEVAKADGFCEEIEWLAEMLRWPVEWSAQYGLAEITTPVGTVYTATDATAEAYRVSYRGAGPTNTIEGMVTVHRGTDAVSESR
jgi:hypothetical protein